MRGAAKPFRTACHQRCESTRRTTRAKQLQHPTTDLWMPPAPTHRRRRRRRRARPPCARVRASAPAPRRQTAASAARARQAAIRPRQWPRAPLDGSGSRSATLLRQRHHYHQRHRRCPHPVRWGCRGYRGCQGCPGCRPRLQGRVTNAFSCWRCFLVVCALLHSLTHTPSAWPADSMASRGCASVRGNPHRIWSITNSVKALHIMVAHWPWSSKTGSGSSAMSLNQSSDRSIASAPP